MRDHPYQTLVPPLIARVLADEQYYGDGPPTWPGAPTSNDAKKARKRYIKRLLRFIPDFGEVKKLAKILARCKQASAMHERCMPRMRASIPAIFRLRGEQISHEHEPARTCQHQHRVSE